MATADEILATMAEEAAATDQMAEVCTIDRCTRAVTIPEALRIVGVETDKDVTRRHFKVLCSYRGTNLSTFRIRIHFMNANKEKDIYYVTDAARDGEYLTFSWVISRNATKYKGKLKFIACMVCDGGTDEEREWNSTLGEFTVLEGLEVELTDGEEEQARDAITQLLAVIDARESEAVEAVSAQGTTQVAAVRAAGAQQEASIAAKGAATLETIPDDYATLHNNVTALTEDMSQYNASDELAGLDFPGTVYNGITVAWNGHTATITGTSTAALNSNIYANAEGFPGNIAPGKLLNIHIDNTDENVQFHIYSYVNGEWSDKAAFKRGADVVQYMLPEDAKGILMRLYVPAGITVDGTFTIGVTTAEANGILEQGGPVLIGDTGHYMQKTIERALAAYGCVTLGKGEFMVTGIEMPDNTTIRGCGAATVIKAASGCDGIIVGANCTVENVSIEGADGHTSQRGTTAGIRVVGNYDESPVKFNTKINNVNIKGFSLAGIYGKSTGYWVANSISATNCKIHNCYAGILLEDYCEFGRFTNMLCYDNYVGLCNMSGNNVFVNCSFSNNTVGVYIVGDQEGLGGNNGHGAVIGCTINHSNNNEGYGIICRGITNGFIFDSCHVWYSKVMVEQCTGIVMQGCTFGGGSTAFTAWTNSAFFIQNCLFKESPSFNGHSVVASGNYLFDGTEMVIQAAEE